MHCIYTDQARAAADLAVVNAVFAAGRQFGDVTFKWAELVQCVEGWAFAVPSEELLALCTPDFITTITLLPSE